MSELKLEDLNEKHIAEAMEISRVEFGSDYLTEDELRGCIGKDDVFCRVAMVDGEVAGLCICRLFGPDRVDEELKLPDSRERDMMMSYRSIGLLDAMAFRDDMKMHGYGTVLAKDGFDRLVSKGAECICAMAWKSVRGTTNAKKLLERLGLTSSLEIQGYWNLMVDSPEGHHCPHCDPPCKCYGVLYTVEVK